MQQLYVHNAPNSGAPRDFVEKMLNKLISIAEIGACEDAYGNSEAHIEHRTRTKRTDSMSIDASAFNDLLLREEFSSLCLQIVLEYSFGQLTQSSSRARCSNEMTSPRSEPVNDSEDGRPLMMETLLSRCRTVLLNYLEDQKLAGQFPLAR